ncbi:hypothetical protein HQ524_02795, partial [Candidatus Uhrbacteria bacterium]|nr:hypothetical protein [Candidatus Uhrbacteria bacterium]
GYTSLTKVSPEQATASAEAWIHENAETFKFDGRDLTHVATTYQKSKCRNCYSSVFTFTSSHAGYGDRSNATNLITEDTEHAIELAPYQNHYIVDDVFDELHQLSYQEVFKQRIDAARVWLTTQSPTFIAQEGYDIDDSFKISPDYYIGYDYPYRIRTTFKTERPGYGPNGYIPTAAEKEERFIGMMIKGQDTNLDHEILIIVEPDLTVSEAIIDNIYSDVAEDLTIAETIHPTAQ